jgi:hypothetical protein
MRRTSILIGCLATVAFCSLCPAAALADSEVPPTDTAGRTFVLIFVGIGVLVVVLLSIAALRGLLRTRSARWSEREYEAQCDRPEGPTDAGAAPPHGGAGS